MKTTIIAEIGINHNGDIKLAKKLIDVASLAGCDAVKFQKRSVIDVYSPEELDAPRDSPWGNTNRLQKMGLEFESEDYNIIDAHCRDLQIDWFASAWDIKSQHFLRQYNCKFNKIASAFLGCPELLNEVAQEKKYTFISTGMSSLKEVARAVNIFQKADCPYELMHCVSTYPMQDSDAQLSMISTLRHEFNCNVGYSGHESGLQISLAAAALGASSIERHITLDRSMYGSDQSASLEPIGLIKLVRDIRIINNAMGDGVKKIIPAEIPIKEKLSQPYWKKCLQP